ncbi:MAG TPA: hypothetical protein VH137_05495, partial [Gemmatimonadales bacterium]|nr:hypothetical protein [Gemmatimonadales bacterium]
VWPVIGLLVGALHVPAGAIGAIIPLWLATTYVTARTTYRHKSRRRVRELDALADRLAALARELAPERPPPPSLPPLRQASPPQLR